MAADGEGYFGKRIGGNGIFAEPPPDARAAHAAAFGLAFRRPECSAIRVVDPAQRRAFGKAAAIAGAGFLLAPELVFGVACWAALAIFTAALLWRAGLYLAGISAARSALAQTAEDHWPTYTLLIALKDEVASVAQLAAALRRLDYPRERLDVKLLVETGDDQTAAALRRESWPGRAELLIVPPGLPRTKPRALNYGLARARGDFVVVYDAEDHPHTDQLKAAVRAFRTGGRNLACVQAPLIGAGAKGWIAGQWALEYAVQFGRLLPGLARLGLPIALGGTSNHFRRAALEAAGGWDPWNVTEDADLGLRLAAGHWRVGTIAPPTEEAPPERLAVWIGQRSRWLKGFVQTWLVLMRRPGGGLADLGLAGVISAHLTLGAAILSALVHGPWAAWLAASLVWPEVRIAPAFLALAGVSYASAMLMAFFAPGPIDLRRFVLAASLPLYWPLQTLAMVRAIYGLFRCPHFWVKTPHGNIIRRKR